MLTNKDVYSLISIISLEGACSVAREDVRTAIAAASMSDDTREALADLRRMQKGGK